MSNDERTRNRFQQQPELLSPQKKKTFRLFPDCVNKEPSEIEDPVVELLENGVHTQGRITKTHTDIHTYMYLSLYTHERVRIYYTKGTCFDFGMARGGCIGLLEEREIGGFWIIKSFHIIFVFFPPPSMEMDGRERSRWNEKK